MKHPILALLALVLSLQACTAAGPQDRPRQAALRGSSSSAANAGAPGTAPTDAPAGKAPAQQQAARRAPPRRHVWQDIVTVPPASAPPSAYQTLPVPQPSPMPEPRTPSTYPAQCGPAGCALPDGTRLQGQGTMIDPSGRVCVQGQATVQCY